MALTTIYASKINLNNKLLVFKIIIRVTKNMVLHNLPEVTDFLKGKSRNVVTLLLSKFRSTEGRGGGAGVSE